MAETRSVPGGGISFTGVLAIGIGATIGIGWVTATRFWFETAGPGGSLLAFFAAFIFVGFTSVAYAEAGSRLRVTGGETAYVDAAFGPTPAFWVGWMLAFSYVCVIAFEIISLVWVLENLMPRLFADAGTIALPGMEIRVSDAIVAVAGTIIAFYVNHWGTKLSVRIEVALTVLLVLLAVTLVLAALWRGQLSNTVPLIAHQGAGWRYEGLIMVFATMLPFYSGFNMAAQSAGEMSRSVTPKQFAIALIAAVVVSWVFHSLVVLAVAMLADRQTLLAPGVLPTVTAFELGIPLPGIVTAVLIAGALGLITTWNATLFATARLLFALGVMGYGPSMGNLHKKYRTPTVALLVPCVVGMVIGLCFKRDMFNLLFNITAFATLFAWTLAVLAAWRIRKSEHSPAEHFSAPLPWLIYPVAIFGLAIATGITIYETVRNFLIGAPIAAIVTVAWILAGVVILYRKSPPSSLSAEDRQLG